MGIDVSLVADLPSAVEGRPVDLETVLGWANPVLDLPAPLDRLAIYTLHDDLLEYALLPIEEPVSFRIERTGLLGRKQRLVVSARTSSAGPGYHAALIAGLDRMAARGGLEWRETEDEFDEAGYFANRDFGALQARHERFLTALGEILVERIQSGEGYSSISLSIETSGVVPRLGGRFATLMGPRSHDFFAEPDPRQHFPWWGEGLRPESCMGVAKALLWEIFPWAAPLSPQDRAVGEVALALIEVAEGVGLSPVPAHELRTLLETTEVVEPAADGVGYRRLTYGRNLPGGWRISVPGWFGRENNEDSAQLFRFAGREVWVTIFSFPQPLDATAREDILASTRADLSVNQGGLVGRAEVRLDDPGTGEPEVWILQGTLVATESLARITIVFPDPDHRPWAEEVFRSVAPPG